MYFWHVFWSFMNSGGAVMWPILGVSVVVWVTGIRKMMQLARLKKARERFLQALRGDVRVRTRSTGCAQYDMLLDSLGGAPEKRERFSYAFREFLLRVMPDIEQGFSTMNSWISAAPLLGLLGTVMGMIRTFEVITLFGIGNPHLMSEGISIALLTTQAGLTAAFPGMLLHNFLLNGKNRFVAAVFEDGEAFLRAGNRGNNGL